MEPSINKDSTNFIIKEQDNNNEMDNFDDLIKENIKDKNLFNEPDHEIKSNYIINTTFHFKQEIERVWMILKCFDILSLISNEAIILVFF